MHLLSCVAQRRQEVCYGDLLSRPDAVSLSGLCPLLHGSQLCLLPKLSVGPDGGRGPQMYDPPSSLCLFPPARSQQLGAVPRRPPLEPDGSHRAAGQARGGAAGRAAQSPWRLSGGQRHHLGGQERQANAGGPKAERPQRQRRPRRLSGGPPLEPGRADQPAGHALAVLAPGDAAGARAQRGSARGSAETSSSRCASGMRP
jgi:hypothetical protein